MTMSQQEFEQLLLTMNSPENVSRKQAEDHYENVRQANPSWAMHALVEVCATSQVPSVSTMGLILLRKLFASTETCYDTSGADVKLAVRNRMIEIFVLCASTKNAKSAAACISALAAKVVKLNEPWDQLWESLFATILSPTSTSGPRGACCEVLYHTSTSLATTYLKGHMQQLATGLNNCLQDKDNTVKRSAFQSLQAISAIVDKKELVTFRPLVPTMLEAVSAALGASDWDGATILCSALADCAEHNADLFTNHTTPLLQAMMQVGASPQVAKEARHMAVEVMCSYCDSDPKAIRKVAGFSKSLFELLFQYMLNPDIPGDWDVTQDDEEATDAEGVTDIDVGCTSLDRVATALKAKQLKDIAQKLFMENIHAEHWQQRNAALVLLTYVSEGLQQPFSEQLGAIISVVAPLTQDAHKMVRYSAVTCLSQFCNDFAPQIQTEFHAQVISAMRASLQDPVPRVQTTAAAALNSFFDNAEDGDDDDESVAKRLTPYVHECCGDLVNLFNASPHLFVKGDCLGALSAIIATCKSGLTPYVDHLVPIFNSVLNAPDTGVVEKDSVLKVMRCKAVECTTLLACGVGKVIFGAYAHPVCQYLISVLRQGLSNDDMRLRYILRGWTCMVECLKEDVLPYLAEVLPPLMAVANLECDLEVVANEVGDEGDDEDDDNEDVKLIKVCLPGHGETTVKVHTSLIEDKELATTIILSFVDELGPKLGTHLDSITTLACTLLEFTATADIRENGAQILASLSKAYTQVSAEKAQQFAEHVIPLLLKAAADENDMTVAGEHLLAASKAFDAATQPCSAAVVTDTASLVHKVLVESVKRRQEILAKKATEQDDEELDTLEDDDADEQNLLSECTRLIQSMLKNATATFLPLFEAHFLPTVQVLVAPNMDETDLKTGLSMLCDYVEFGKSLTYLPTVANTFVTYAAHADESVAQAAFYGLGVVLDAVTVMPASDPTATQFGTQVSQLMSSYLVSPNARKEEFEHTTCNAVSTALKAINYHGTKGTFDAARLFNLCIGFLPTGGDDIESCRLHELLLTWVVAGNPIIVNPLVIVHALKRAKPDMLNDATKAELTKRFP